MATERTSSPGLARTISDQLLETVAAAFKQGTPSSDAAAPSGGGGPASSSETGGTLSRKSSRRLIPLSPGPGSTSRNAHIRKSRSAQLNRAELDEVTSGAALSRASSASLGFSFSFTGFSMPPDDIADSKPFSDDDDIPEDLEAGMQRPKFQAEPTLPIYLKVMVLAMEAP